MRLVTLYYKFEYDVEDHYTGEKKSQHEHRNEKKVEGSYALKEADGTIRIVKYFTVARGGYNAVVQGVSNAQHPAYYGHDHDYEGCKHGGKSGISYVGITHYGYGY